MKKFLVLALALSFTFSATHAATTFGDALKNAVKSDIDAVKNAVKTDITNKASQAKTQSAETKKAKKAEIEAKRNAQLAPILKQIEEKEAALKNAKNDKTLSETQKTIKTRTYQRQLEVLKTKKDSINKLFDAQLKAL